MGKFYALSLPFVKIITIFVICIVQITCASDLEDFTNPEIVSSILHDELQNLHVELTKSFVADHSRRKREIIKHTYEISLDSSSDNYFESRTESIGYSTVIYKDESYVFQANGIYRLEGHLEKRKPSLVQVTRWELDRGERVLCAQEWDGKLFILTSNQNGSYSRIYTVQGADFSLIPRQQIRNQGYASSARFYVHSADLYLIITNDNRAHSTTITPIYRWARTYMDQIHEIQTRGASAVEVFSISIYTYIAIAQSEDENGNHEVGTLIVRMLGKGELEKVQLLWSYEPVSLKYVRLFKEHFLIVGQHQEASIAYWFGGYDFVYWQSFDGLQGKQLYLDSLILPNGDPLLLASTESQVSIYTPAKNPQVHQTSILNRTSVLYSTSSSSNKIVESRFMMKSESEVYLVLTIQSYSSTTTLKVFPVAYTRIPIPESQYKDSEDKLSTCMESLTNALDYDEPFLNLFEAKTPYILTKNEDADFKGTIISESSIFFGNGDNTRIREGIVQPELSYPAEDKYEYSPSASLALVEKSLSSFEYLVQDKLSQVLHKSESGNITGDLTFTKKLVINNLKVHSDLKLETINDIPWSVLENDVLRNGVYGRGQTVTGNWRVDTVKSNSFQGGNKINDIAINDFLLTKCGQGGYNQKQTLYGKFIFNKNVQFGDGITLGPSAKINDIEFGSLALSSSKYLEIRGFKHSDFVRGEENLDIDLINGLKLGQWYASVLKTYGEEQYSVGEKTFTGDLIIDNLVVDNLNGQNWNAFVESLLLNGRNQTIYGDLLCKKLRVNELTTQEINRQLISDLMTTSTDQFIKSKITVGDLRIRRNLYAGSINGIDILDSIRKTETNVIITGPIEFTRLSIMNDISLGNYVKINEIDISEVAELRKKHIYSYGENYSEEIWLDGNVATETLTSEYLNGVRFDGIRDFYWRSDANNLILEDFNFKNTKVEIEGDFRTGTVNGLRTDSQIVTANKNNEVIGSKIEFRGDVIVQGNVIMPNGVTLNEIDFSERVKQIIRMDEVNSYRKIRGHKVFQDNLQLSGGLKVDYVNGINLERDVVLLESRRNQIINGKKKFQTVKAQKIDSEVDIEVYGTVNGYKLKEIEEITVYQDNKLIQIDGDIVFKNYLTLDELYVANEINGMNFNEIVSKIIPLDKPANISAPLIAIGGGLKFREDSIVGSINGVNVNAYLSKVVNKHEDTYFTGTKEFNDITIEGNLNCQKINNIDLIDIEKNALSKSKDQVITGHITFQELRSEGDLITERISGISISDIVRTDESIVIENDVIFTGEFIAKKKIQLNGLLNGYKIEMIAEGLTSLNGDRKFETITVNGNLNWEYSLQNLKRLSYLLNNAVTFEQDQNITGKVTFNGDLYVDYIKSNKWINDINLEELLEDSVFLNKPIILTGSNIFAQNLDINSGFVRVTENLNTPEINNIILQELYKEVVRKEYKRSIKGEKTFEYGLSVNNLVVQGTIDGIYPKELVTINDKRTIDQITLTDVRILENLDFRSINGIQISEILNQRISLHEDQKIYGTIYVDGDVTISDCQVNRINELSIHDIYKRDAEYRQTFVGRKTFNNVKIQGSLEDTSINGYRFETIANQILRRSENEIIDRHVIFKDSVTIAKDVNVSKHINSYYIDTVTKSFTEKLTDIISSVRVTETTKTNTTELILQLETTQKSSAPWLNYLQLWEEFYECGSVTRVEHFINEADKSVTIALHSNTDGAEAGLPAGCKCDTIYFLELDQITYTAKEVSRVNCLRVFDVKSETGPSYTVYSQVVSYNDTCSKAESGTTFVSYMHKQQNRYKIHRGDTNPLAEFSIGKIDTGYISDVKAFSSKGKEYLVISQFFNRKSGGHNTEVLIYETTNGSLKRIQGIQSKAAVRLSLEFVGSTWILVIANRQVDETCETKSGIYEWSESSYQFILLREVPTIDTQDTALISVQDYNSEVRESFVAFAENEDKAYGKISIYQFDSLSKNYVHYQTLEYDGVVAGITSFSLPKYSYLLVTLPVQGTVLVYEYLYSEGFRLKTQFPVIAAYDINVIELEERVFFPIGSKIGKSILAEGIIEGVLNPEKLPRLTEVYEGHGQGGVPGSSYPLKYKTL